MFNKLKGFKYRGLTLHEFMPHDDRIFDMLGVNNTFKKDATMKVPHLLIR
jgi:hypothetical protein